ncbi:MAG: hypothetical protein ABIK23_06675 [candidate division WOR-3 bacterium]
MLKGILKKASGYVETWGTFKGVLEVWQAGKDLEVKGACTDIVELYSWLLPSIASAHPEKEIYLGEIRIPETDPERELLKQEIRLFLEENSARMERVEPQRLAQGQP